MFHVKHTSEETKCIWVKINNYCCRLWEWNWSVPVGWRYVPLSHLHDLLDPVHIDRHPDEDVGLTRMSTAPHGNDHTLKYPAVPVLTRQRAAVVSLQTHRNNTLESLFVSVMTDCHCWGWKHLAVTSCPVPLHYPNGECVWFIGTYK